MKINDDLLEKVIGGYDIDNIVNIVTKLLADYDIEIERELIVELINKGGLTLRNFVVSKLPKEDKKVANIIPSFD